MFLVRLTMQVERGETTARPDRRVCAREEGDQQVMPLVQVLIVLIVVGFLLWLVNRLIPMQSTIKSILNAVVIICVAIWLLNVFGILPSLSKIRVGHVGR